MPQWHSRKHINVSCNPFICSNWTLHDPVLSTSPTTTMICHRCLLRAAKRSKSIPFVTNRDRTISTTSARRAQAVTAQTTTAINPRPEDRPAATSTSAAQPFSTPLSPSPDRQDLPIQPEQTKAASRIQSSVPAGTVLKGLNFVKGKQDPVALEDSEYPAWLWSVLREKSDAAGNKGTDGEGDLFCTSTPSYSTTGYGTKLIRPSSEIQETAKEGSKGSPQTATATPGVSGAEDPGV